MNKFKWITTKIEYEKMLTYLENEIEYLQCEPYPNETTKDLYIKLINDRDELLDHGIDSGF